EHVARVQTAAHVRVVREEDVAGTDVVAVPLDHGADAVALRGPVRDVRSGPCDQVTGRVEDTDRVVLRLGDDRADPGPLHRVAGILGDRAETMSKHLDRDRVDRIRLDGSSAHGAASMMQVPYSSIRARQLDGNHSVVSTASITAGPT